MKKAEKTPAAVNPEIAALVKGSTITVNDDRFTAGPNHKKATFYQVTAAGDKMQVTIGGKFAWLTVDKYVGPAQTWQEEQAAKKGTTKPAADAPAQAPAPEADKAASTPKAAKKAKAAPAPAPEPEPVKESKPEPVLTTVFTVPDPVENATAPVTPAPTLEEIKAGVEHVLTKAAPALVAAAQPEKVTKVGELIIARLKSVGDAAETLSDIAAGLGRAAAAIKGNLARVVEDGYVKESKLDGGVFYFLTAKGQEYVFTGKGSRRTVRKAKPKKDNSEKESVKRLQVMTELWNTGKTNKEVAEITGYNIEKVREVKVIYERKKITDKGEKLFYKGDPNSKRGQVVALLDAGKTASEIIKIVGCDPSYVYYSKHLTLKK